MAHSISFKQGHLEIKIMSLDNDGDTPIEIIDNDITKVLYLNKTQIAEIIIQLAKNLKNA